jgi:general secretion pathway protein G
MLLTTVRSARVIAGSRGARRAAFTLLEVLIVVAILVILAGAASFAYFRYLEDAKVGRAKSDMRIIESALKKYYLEHDDYPQPDQIGLLAPYLEQGELGLMDPWNRPYSFQVQPVEDTTSVDGGFRAQVLVICQGAPGRQPFTVPDQVKGR